MSRYTDSNFGFSFWYPTAWNVTNKPVTDATGFGWFADATIVKELQITNPAPDDVHQPTGVLIQEVSAPKGLTELGSSKSASPVGIDQRYLFDGETNRWMYAQLSDGPNGAHPGPVQRAEITRRTMGGLPIFWGASRHGAERIVPLDKSHFLAISTMDVGGYDSHNYLAATVVATKWEAGNQVSVQTQVETVHREALKLGAVGKSVASWYRDGRQVYNWKGDLLRGADGKSFAPLSDERPGIFFATDGVHVYSANSGVIPGADPKTFIVMSPVTARDAHHTYNWSGAGLKIGAATAP